MLPLLPSPVFPGLYEFCSIFTGASLEGAAKLNCGVRWDMFGYVRIFWDMLGYLTGASLEEAAKLNCGVCWDLFGYLRYEKYVFIVVGDLIT